MAWIVAAGVMAVAGTVGGLLWFTGSPAKQVTLHQAESRLPPGRSTGPVGLRPLPGVYEYRGSGTDRLTRPPKSQAHGPSMPGTVTLSGRDCWRFRIDYSTHHWQSWDFCRRGAEMRQTGGQLWQLWPLGPISLTNSTSILCAPEATVVPDRPTAGQEWTARCTATSSAVKGAMQSSATYHYLGRTSVLVDGERVTADHISITQTDQGAQRGRESYQMWIASPSGLMLRMDQDISVTTDTPLGASTYAQKGTLSLVSPVAHQG